MLKQCFLICLLGVTSVGITACAAEQPLSPNPVIPKDQQPQAVLRWGYEVINTYPHDPKAFTQGLVFDQGRLLESTGHYGRSTLREVTLETGTVLKQHKLPDRVFGEGITLFDNRIFSLTWRSQKGFVFEESDFHPLQEFQYDGEGWGLTHDGTNLIMSNGTATLKYFDPETASTIKSLTVTYAGDPVYQLNELEWIKGSIFANIWQTDLIIRIDPVTGNVTGAVNLAGLLAPEDIIAGETDVLNGIAYDAATDRLFVTGKNWPKLFEIKLVPLN